MSLLQIYDDVGTSPIDIAKAFMGARTSALNTASRSVLLKDERVPPYCDGLASSSSIPSTPMRSPICWPGAMIQEVPGYLTPQTQRGRISLHNLPRTPYNRAPYSRSISKVCVVIDITFHYLFNVGYISCFVRFGVWDDHLHFHAAISRDLVKDLSTYHHLAQSKNIHLYLEPARYINSYLSL